MKGFMQITALAAGLLLLAASVHSGEDAAGKKSIGEEIGLEPHGQTICPVMGGKIDKTVFADKHGQRVYFCCAACIDIFENDPDKYFEKSAEEGVIFENVQTACPVTGEPFDEHYFLDYEGRRVFFCGEDCTQSFLYAPARFLEELDGQTDGEGKDKKHDHGHGHDHEH